MMDQVSANERFELIVWSLGRRCRWRARALGLTLSTKARRMCAGVLGLAAVMTMSGALRSLVATVERGLAAWGR